MVAAEVYTRDYSNVSKTRFYVCIGYVVTIEDSCRLRVQTVLRCMYNCKQTASLLTRIASRAINGRAYSLNVRTSGPFNKYTLRIFVKNISISFFIIFLTSIFLSFLLSFFFHFIRDHQSLMNLDNFDNSYFFYRIYYVLTQLFRTLIYKNLNNIFIIFNKIFIKRIFNKFFKLFIHPHYKIYTLYKFDSYFNIQNLNIT